MKKNYLLLVLLFTACVLNAQNIVFSDPNFKAKLLEASPSNDIAKNSSLIAIAIDTDQDGEISIAEVQPIHQLAVGSSGIGHLGGIEHFTNLQILEFNNNNLNDISYLALLPNLKQLYCGGNPLHTLDATPFLQLTHLLCEGCELTSLNISGMTNLQTVYCGSNLFTGIELTNLPNLIVFHCCCTSSLVHLDLSQLHSLYNLFVYSSPMLESINMKNGSIENQQGVNFESCPALQYICTDESQVNTIKSVVDSFGNTTCVVNSYCSFVPGGIYYTIAGESKLDMQGDGCNSSDIPYPYMKYTITGNQTGTLVSNQDGAYTIPVSAGSHMLTPVFENPSYFIATPTSSSVSFPSQNSPAVRNFCVTPNGTHNDLEVVIVPLDVARPGFDANYKIICKNKGNTAASGNLTFEFDNSVLDFVLANPVIDTQTANSLTWNFSNLFPFQTREFLVTLNVNSPIEVPAVNDGDILVYMASILADFTDESPLDNTFVLNQEVSNSFDPNDKTCLEGNTIEPSMVGKYVHYQIRFENTGTANAENIVVKDIIDTNKFDISSLVPMDGSHDFVTRINGNKVEFIFENIQLPFDDANNDGYVMFKIKTKSTLVVGDSFSNSASIYFDYNHPIVTDPAVTTIQLLNVKDFEFSDEFALYPNPAHDVLNIQSKNNTAISSAEIYNQLGQLLLSVTDAKGIAKIDVAHLTSGNYFIKTRSAKGTTTAKFAKK